MIDLNVMINEIMQDLELQIELKTLHVQRYEASADRGHRFPDATGVPESLSNSIKFSKDDQPCAIHVSGELVSEKSFNAPSTPDGDFCRVVVADNGIGFSNEFRGRIFEIFHRLSNKVPYEGTGDWTGHREESD